MAAVVQPCVYLSGPDVQRLMRRHHVTIRALSARMGLPMTRIRVRRQQGIQDPHVARDWMEAITGHDPGTIHGPVSLEYLGIPRVRSPHNDHTG